MSLLLRWHFLRLKLLGWKVVNLSVTFWDGICVWLENILDEMSWYLSLSGIAFLGWNLLGWKVLILSLVLGWHFLWWKFPGWKCVNVSVTSGMTFLSGLKISRMKCLDMCHFLGLHFLRWNLLDLKALGWNVLILSVLLGWNFFGWKIPRWKWLDMCQLLGLHLLDEIFWMKSLDVLLSAIIFLDENVLMWSLAGISFLDENFLMWSLYRMKYLGWMI